MRPVEKIRTLLRSKEYFESGLTIKSIAVLTGRTSNGIARSLARMPDAYIFDWVTDRGGPGRFAQIWRVVIPPANKPPPPKRSVR